MQFNHYESSEALYRETLALMESTSEESSDVLNRALQGLGTVLGSQGKLEEAEETLRRGLQLAKQSSDKETLASSLGDLANLLYIKADYTHAAALARDSIELYESLPNQHPSSVGDQLSMLAATLCQLGKIDQAEDIFRRAIALCERHEGKTPNYASLLNNLGTLLHQRGVVLGHRESLRESMDVIHQGLMLNKVLLGPRHTTTLDNTTNLAAMLQTTGELEEAEILYREAIPILRSIRGDRHPQILVLLHNFAMLRSDQGWYDEAEQLLAEVICLCEEVFGADHLTSVQFHLKLARNHLRAGHESDARNLYSKYVPLKEEKLGKDHPDAINSRQEFLRAFPSTSPIGAEPVESAS